MPSFDTVSELNAHEVANAVDQANRELGQRFDFKDTGAVFELEEFTVKMRAQVEFQLKQMLDILKLRLSKRGIDLAYLDVKDAQTTLATSSGLPMRPSGTSGRASGGKAAVSNGVSIAPGATTLTRTPTGAAITASDRARPSSPALAAA